MQIDLRIVNQLMITNITDIVQINPKSVTDTHPSTSLSSTAPFPVPVTYHRDRDCQMIKPRDSRPTFHSLSGNILIKHFASSFPLITI